MALEFEKRIELLNIWVEQNGAREARFTLGSHNIPLGSQFTLSLAPWRACSVSIGKKGNIVGLGKGKVGRARTPPIVTGNRKEEKPWEVTLRPSY